VGGAQAACRTIPAHRFFERPVALGLRAAIDLASKIGMERIEKRHRLQADYILGEMVKRGAESWTSPDPSLRCAIVTVNVPSIQRMDLENWLWKTHQDPYPWRGAIQAAPVYSLLSSEERYRSVSGEVRRVTEKTFTHNRECDSLSDYTSYRPESFLPNNPGESQAVAENDTSENQG